MKFNLELAAKLITIFWPQIQKALDKVLRSTTLDEKLKDITGNFLIYGEKLIIQTLEALLNAEEQNDTIAKGIMFKLARVLKVFTLKAQNLIDRIEIEFGEIDLDPDKY